ncbi:hypothetical protein [Aquimarina spongiae]|uniref:Uncharacterized protein n=1 Tax=Aquimarina spongiae TaxID=570521 RepID=A0A1M6CCJ9_9FLAO|nr:hypothetical protein [Aquimarina spongiae]SHI58504.1 hypothetical protein SAMN04488508_10243 [Aquimarina spongiae]
MRKLLLFLIAVSVIGISSCTKDDVEEISQEEKILLVKQTLTELNKSVKSGKYQEFVTVLAKKSATETLSEEEIEDLFVQIFGDNSQAFINLYFQLKAINMTGEEFLKIADQFEYLRPNLNAKMLKDSGASGCEYLWCALIDWVSGGGEREDKEDPTGDE